MDPINLKEDFLIENEVLKSNILAKKEIKLNDSVKTPNASLPSLPSDLSDIDMESSKSSSDQFQRDEARSQEKDKSMKNLTSIKSNDGNKV